MTEKLFTYPGTLTFRGEYDWLGSQLYSSIHVYDYEEVERAYWFRLVCPCVDPFDPDIVLKLHVHCMVSSWENSRCIFLLSPLVKLWPYEKYLLVSYPKVLKLQGTKIFKYCTCPAGRVTYNFHWSCKRMHMSFKSVCNKEHK